jgi:hypothetical protein
MIHDPTMGPNRPQDRERAAAEAATKAKRDEAERKAIAEAQKIVAIWNARQAGGRALWFYPTIGAAIAAGLPWLTFSCPGCGQYALVDLLHARSAPRRRGLKPHPVPVLPEMLAQCPVREARNADGGAALTPRHFDSVRLRGRVSSSERGLLMTSGGT